MVMQFSSLGGIHIRTPARRATLHSPSHPPRTPPALFPCPRGTPPRGDNSAQISAATRAPMRQTQRDINANQSHLSMKTPMPALKALREAIEVLEAAELAIEQCRHLRALRTSYMCTPLPNVCQLRVSLLLTLTTRER